MLQIIIVIANAAVVVIGSAAVESGCRCASRRQVDFHDFSAGGFDHLVGQFHHFWRLLFLLKLVFVPILVSLGQAGRLGCFNLTGRRFRIVTLQRTAFTHVSLLTNVVVWRLFVLDLIVLGSLFIMIVMGFFHNFRLILVLNFRFVSSRRYRLTIHIF